MTSFGTEFVTLGDEGRFAESLAGLMAQPSSPERFVLLKSREDIDRYLGIVDSLRPKHIFEFGIYRGGSTAFLMEIAQPKVLVAIEYDPEPVDALDTYLARTADPGRCNTYYGLDQADVGALRHLVDTHFAGEPLDLVIDDASHLGPETRASFETLFPLVRPGGLYIIEDWSWYLQGLNLPGQSLETFVADLVTAGGRGPGLIAGIELAWDVLVVRRGMAQVDPSEFALSRWFDRMV